MARKAEIRKTLSEYVTYERAVGLRNELKTLALLNYEPRRTPEEYLAFIKDNAEVFHLEHATPQDSNCLYAYELFTVKSQRVLGDCLEECIDNAIELAEIR